MFDLLEPLPTLGTARENILFGADYEENKYNEVVRACSLTRDFQLFPDGDQTIIGQYFKTGIGGNRIR